MRILSYNILDGGVGRADPLAEVIIAQRGDVVVLVEADDTAVIERIGRRLGMQFVRGQGKRHGTAIFCRWPIVESIDFGPIRPGLSGCFLAATIHPPQGEEIEIAAVHLHPHAREEDETIRQAEIQILLDAFAAQRESGRAHLLAGDFNANSPDQSIDPAKCKPRTRKDWQANGGNLPRRAVGDLLAAGYVDTLAAVRGEAANTTGSFTTQFPGQRVDYIFAHAIPREKLIDAWIEQDRLAQFASDHFPVGLEIA